MLKKFISFAVGTACLVSMVGVSAATVNQATTTKYGANGITVTTTVTGAQDGDTLTYLAQDKTVTDTPTDKQIVYIDQKVVDTDDETTQKFTYTTSYANIGATVRVGGSAILDGSGITAANSSIPGIVLKKDDTALTDITVEATTAGLSGYVKVSAPELSGMVISGLSSASGVAITDGWFTGNGSLYLSTAVAEGNSEINLVVDSTLAVGIGTVDMALVKSEDGDSIVVLGYAAGVDDFGIVIGNDTTFTADEVKLYTNAEADTEDAGFNAFPALGRGSDQMFAVEVGGFESFKAADGTLYATTYMIKDGSYYFGKTFMVDANSAVTVTGGKVATASQASLEGATAGEVE